MSVVDLSMSSPVSSPPPSPKPGSIKRKAENGEEVAQDKAKKAKADDRIEVKGRKVHFRQEPYQRTLPRRRLLNFEGWLLDAEEAGTPPSEIPDEFYDLVVMAGHELSSSSEASFLKSIKAELVKGDSGEALKNELLVPLITKLFDIKQYGFKPADFGVTRIPAGLQIRCWEAKDLDQYFPADKVAELAARRAEREQAREECERMLAAMDDAEKAEFLKGDKAEKVEKKGDTEDKPKVEDAAAASMSSAVPSPAKSRATRGTSTASDSRARSTSPIKRGKKVTAEEAEEAEKVKEQKEAKKEERRKEQEEKRKEQEEKRQQREEKKAEKERVQQKQAQVKAKQTNMFTSFFKKAAPATPPPAPVCEAGPSNSAKQLSAFQIAFPPAQRRANVDQAPETRFASSLRATASSEANVAKWSPKDFIRDHLEHNQLQPQNPRCGRARGLKFEPLHGTVADMWSAYQEAEDPRAVLDELRDRRKFPWKTLAFDQQLRPPYAGTFTKKSLAVGPRTPFAQDPVFDYSYDSGDDWQEEEEGGDDIDQPAEEEADEDAVSEDEGEFDDWLDNAEDPVFASAPDGDVVMAEPTSHPASPKKRVPVKRITKLTPTWQGPVWESVIAEPTEGLDEYRIQLLNDTPASINPFEYQSSDPLPQFKTTFSDTAVGNQLRVRCLLSAKETNTPEYAPAKPTSMPLGDASSSANKIAPKARNPKVAFPAKHLPELLRIVDGNTRILTDLISHLKIRFDKATTKAAIEAKIREVAVREGKSKDSAWKVKSEAWYAAGIARPPPPVVVAMNGSSD